MNVPSIVPTIADLESALDRAERDIVCADMIDNQVRRLREIKACRARRETIAERLRMVRLAASLREEGSGLSINAAEAIEELLAGYRLSEWSVRGLADDAFDVLNWAKRQGFDRERQIAELVRTFEFRLGYRKAVEPAEEPQS